MSNYILMCCPFCGGQAQKDFEPDNRIYTVKEKWWVSCRDCGVQTRAYPAETEAVLAWNRRGAERKKK